LFLLGVGEGSGRMASPQMSLRLLKVFQPGAKSGKAGLVQVLKEPHGNVYGSVFIRR
jgi:hypothetical protein